MKAFKKFVVLCLAILFLIPLGAARADAAPPMNPPGGDVSPEGGTQVQMTAEQVTIDFRPNTDDSANVSAWFLFRNTGDQPEHLKVRFPLNGDPQGNKADNSVPLIEDFTARIGSQELATQTVMDTDPNAEQFFLGWTTIIYWAVFDMDFPAGQDVKLTISYTLHPTEQANYADVHYLLATGAGWKGPIGKVDVIVLFPYILNDFNFPNMNSYNNWDDGSGRSTTILENQVRLHYDDLEPTQENNVSVGVISPHLWQEVLRRRVQVIGTPDNPQAWLALARAYQAAGQEKHGMFIDDQYSFAYLQAFERALTLDPNDASLHMEFATGLSRAIYSQDSFFSDTLKNELATVIKLDPGNADAIAILGDTGMNSSDLPTPGPFPTRAIPTPTPDVYATPVITPFTVTATPTLTLVSTIIPPTLLPVVQPTPEEGGKSTSTGLLILAGLLLLCVGFGTGWLLRRK